MRRLSTPRVRMFLIGAIVLLLTASAAVALDSRLRAVKRIGVYDANDRFVGEVIDVAGGSVTVAVRLGETPIFLYLLGHQFDGAGNTVKQRLVFESDDCTGLPFAEAFSDPTDLIPVVVLNGTKLYSPATISEARTIQVQSVLETDGLCTPLSFESQVAQLTQLADLAAEFTPPFTTRPQ